MHQKKLPALGAVCAHKRVVAGAIFRVGIKQAIVVSMQRDVQDVWIVLEHVLDAVAYVECIY